MQPTCLSILLYKWAEFFHPTHLFGPTCLFGTSEYFSLPNKQESLFVYSQTNPVLTRFNNKKKIYPGCYLVMNDCATLPVYYVL